MQCVERVQGGDIEEKSTIESIAAVCRIKKKQKTNKQTNKQTNKKKV